MTQSIPASPGRAGVLTDGRFDLWAATYDRSALRPLHQAAHHAVLAEAGRYPHPPGRILDIGCGTGRLLSALHGRYPSASLVAGIDPSAAMLSHAVKAPSPRLYAVAAAEHLPFPDSSFGIVTTTMSLRHWESISGAMKEIRRVLTPDGIFIAVDTFRARNAQVVRRVRIPLCLYRAMTSAGLRIISARLYGGFGPVSHLTAITAVRQR